MKAPSAPLAVALAKVAASAAVLAAGFRAVSDDDFARVVIAEEWARSPRWDASGTSWLPFPFWITGLAMKLLGRSLDTARAAALLLGVLAALLVYASARWIGEDRVAAAGGAVVAALFPWSARLGVATVPELFTAALTLLAMAATVSRDPRRRLAGGAAICAACLSRYEAWPVALVFAALSLLDALKFRTARVSERSEPRASASAGSLVGAAIIALAGPAAWVAWNRILHGDALHFLARVAAYRQALGGAEGGAAGRLWAYPVAMLREEPEVAALVAMSVLLAARAGILRDRVAPYARPVAIAALQIAALSLAMIKDGAPTHHPERAVLAALLLLAVMGGAATVHLARKAWWHVPALAGAAVLAAVIGRSGPPREGFVNRSDEVAIGRAAGATASPGDKILVEVADYGFLAVRAASGRPEDVEADRSVDPRDAKTASSFAEAGALRARLASSGARWVAARTTETTAATLGVPVQSSGAWGLYRVGGGP